MPTPTYPFSNITDLRTFITDIFTANGDREITGPNAHDALLGICDLISPVLQATLLAQLGSGGSVGGIADGTSFAEGQTLESVLIALLTKTIHPTYVAPTAALSSDNGTLNSEVGTIISPTLSIVFTQNDGGAQTAASLKKNGTQISTTLPFTDANVTLADAAPVAYQALVSFAQGACKNNNLGVQDCTGRITAGNTNTNTITYNGFRKVFFGVPVAVPTTSANVRALAGSALNPQNGTVFTINIPAGSLNVSFAYPASLEDVASVKYVELSNAEVKGNFTKTTISVAGAGGYTSVNYSVWTFTPVEAFSAAATYQVTI